MFLGMVTYLRKFVPNYAQIAGPLFDLLKGHEKKGHTPLFVGEKINSSASTF